MSTRRVIISRDKDGKSIILSDGSSPHAKKFRHTPGFAIAPLWASKASDGLAYVNGDEAASMATLLPEPGETLFMTLTIPPDTVMTSPDWNPALAAEELFAAGPAIAATFEQTSPGTHTTPTIDYGVVLDGEISLELDDGEQVHLRVGDSFVQHATRHAWRNPGTRPATIAVVLMGR